MAHIISFMDDTLHAGARGSSFPEAMTTRQQASVNQHKRVAQAQAAGENSATDAVPVRMDRVHALRAAIADGSYAVSASDVADKILQTMLKK